MREYLSICPRVGTGTRARACQCDITRRIISEVRTIDTARSDDRQGKSERISYESNRVCKEVTELTADGCPEGMEGRVS